MGMPYVVLATLLVVIAAAIIGSILVIVTKGIIRFTIQTYFDIRRHTEEGMKEVRAHEKITSVPGRAG
jgi:hypothetical protein